MILRKIMINIYIGIFDYGVGVAHIEDNIVEYRFSYLGYRRLGIIKMQL